jgi:hypothetical protein
MFLRFRDWSDLNRHRFSGFFHRWLDVQVTTTWLGPRPMPYTFGGRSFTRRRRCVRRVWFDEEYKTDSCRPGGMI